VRAQVAPKACILRVSEGKVLSRRSSSVMQTV
jgi:hypothetical protein